MSTTKQQTTEQNESLRILASFAKDAGLDLNASSEQMFRCSPDQLTKEQRLELLKMSLRAAPKPQTRNHFCVECREPKSCEKKDCGHDETICQRCTEGDSPRDDYWLHNKTVVMQ
jgi:hypothetical protein